MFGVGQGLELAHLIRRPGVAGFGGPPEFPGDSGEEAGLRKAFLGLEASAFPGGLQVGKVDMRGQVQFARLGKQVGD